MLSERVLEILDRHEFDWFNIRPYQDMKVGNILKHVDTCEGKIYYTCCEDYNTEYSLAEIATNKSALTAAIDYFFSKESIELNKAKRRGDTKDTLIKQLQRDLIYDLTNNSGKEFWNIFAEHMGIK